MLLVCDMHGLTWMRWIIKWSWKWCPNFQAWENWVVLNKFHVVWNLKKYKRYQGMWKLHKMENYIKKNATWRWSEPTCKCLIDLQLFSESVNLQTCNLQSCNFHLLITDHSSVSVLLCRRPHVTTDWQKAMPMSPPCISLPKWPKGTSELAENMKFIY